MVKGHYRLIDQPADSEVSVEHILAPHRERTLQRMGSEDTVRRLFDEVRNAPARGTCTVELNRLSARVKASKQTPKSRRAARRAEVTLRYQPVALPCPGAAAVELWVVHAREERPPPKAEALEWFVPTTLPVTCTADAQRVSGTRFADASRITSASSSPGARSRSCSTTPPSASDVPSPSRWWWVGASS